MFKLLSRLALFITVMTLNDQYSRLFYLGSFVFTPKKIFTLVLLGLSGLKGAISPHRLARNPKNLCIALFALAGIPSYVMSYLMGVSIRDVVIPATGFYAVILLYFMIVYVVEDERDLEIVIWAAIVGAALVGFTALTGFGEVSEGRYERAGGLGRNPNLAATYSVTGLTMGVLLFLERTRSAPRRAFLLFLIALALFGVLESLSRTGFLCIVAVTGFLLVRVGRTDVLRWALPLILILGLAFVFLAPDQYFERIATSGQEAEDLATINLANRRILGWWEGIKAFAASPVVGVGRVSLRLWISKHSPHAGEITPHNSYLHVLATMGLSGFLPWMTAIVINWRDFSRVQRWGRMFRERRDAALGRLSVQALFLQGAYLVWLVASLVSPFADDEGLWLLLALGTVMAQLGRQRAMELAAEAPLETAETFYARNKPVRAG